MTIHFMIVISTGEVNRSGWRLEPSGGDATHYKKNPILLFQHSRASSWRDPDEQSLPVGRIENLRLEKGQWVADDPIFDEDDKFALKLKKKFDKGMLNAFSPGILPLQTSTEPNMIKPGQTRATVSKWQFLEISLVDIPKDGNATRLCLSSQSEDEIVPLLKTQESMDFNKIALELGLSANATEEQIINAIKTQKQAAIGAVIELGQAKGVINEKNKSHFEQLAASNLDATRGFILNADTANKTEGTQITENVTPTTETSKAKEEPVTMAAFLKEFQKLNLGGGQQEKGKEDWDFDKWSKEDPKGLRKMQQEEPEKYKALALAYGNK
jgi:hypothetical protein